jgi:hypothetical protein
MSIHMNSGSLMLIQNQPVRNKRKTSQTIVYWTTFSPRWVTLAGGFPPSSLLPPPHQCHWSTTFVLPTNSSESPTFVHKSKPEPIFCTCISLPIYLVTSVGPTVAFNQYSLSHIFSSVWEIFYSTIGQDSSSISKVQLVPFDVFRLSIC